MFKKPSSGKSNLSQYGLLDVDLEDIDNEPMDLSDDDMDLEAELAALSGEGGGRSRPKPRKPAPVLGANFDAMVAASLQDVPSDDDESGDEDDPELLSELKELALDDEAPPAPPPRVGRPAPPPPGSSENPTVTLLQDRIANYMQAERNAKANNESSRARRFGRGLKTLNDLLKQAKIGHAIKDEDIPPPVSLGKSAPQLSPQEPLKPEPVPIAPEQPPIVPVTEEEPPSLPEPVGPPPTLPSESSTTDIDPEKAEGLQLILRRKQEFKAAALSSKQSGDKELALELLKVSKQFDMVVDAYKSGQEMDLNELPTPQSIEAAFRSQGKEDNQTQGSGTEPPPTAAAGSDGLIVGATLQEGLKLRLSAFQKQEAKAKEEGNSSKARRMGRIVKQYQEAIKLHLAGKPLPIDELPAPLGHGPLPNADGAASPPKPPPRAAPSPSPSPSPAPMPSSSSRYDKQLALLLLKQKQFKEAAIKAKKAGNIEEAKEYLRAAKRFDSVIEAARGGLVIDLKSLPLPPRAKSQLENSYDIVSSEDCGPTDDAPTTISIDDDDVLGRLHRQLASQLKLCLANRDHNQAMGHIAEANRFDHLAVTVQQDLDVVAVAKKLGRDPPKFHYESRQFTVVQCNTDLNENDLELTIVRGIAYNVPNPKEVDTYVKFEFPYPQDAPVSDRTAIVKDTNTPEYNAVFPLVINRSARACLRVFKRHGIKLEVVSKGGWFRSDAALGAATVKLAPLEDRVTLHEAFPLMDGRRPAGGSLEVKLRVRTPLLHQQVVKSSHRWLVIDH
ncbi:hypothetical protein ACJJTC_016010 [Scirpophaga incertulas]